jgi:starvation-inducible outer membrane lipoprotein
MMTKSLTFFAPLALLLTACLSHPMSAQQDKRAPVEATQLVEVAISGMT